MGMGWDDVGMGGVGVDWNEGRGTLLRLRTWNDTRTVDIHAYCVTVDGHHCVLCVYPLCTVCILCVFIVSMCSCQ